MSVSRGGCQPGTLWIRNFVSDLLHKMPFLSVTSGSRVVPGCSGKGGGFSPLSPTPYSKG